MKSFKIEFSLALNPHLAVLTSVLLGAIVLYSFSSSINIANSQSLRLSSPSSSLQSQQPPQQQQKALNTNGISITGNLNGQQMLHQPFPISLQSSAVKSLQSQQQQNQLPHQEQQEKHQNMNGINDGDKPDNHLPSMAHLLPVTNFPEPMCYFNMGPLFCPHYIWELK